MQSVWKNIWIKYVFRQVFKGNFTFGCYYKKSKKGFEYHTNGTKE